MVLIAIKRSILASLLFICGFAVACASNTEYAADVSPVKNDWGQIDQMKFYVWGNFQEKIAGMHVGNRIAVEKHIAGRGGLIVNDLDEEVDVLVIGDATHTPLALNNIDRVSPAMLRVSAENYTRDKFNLIHEAHKLGIEIISPEVLYARTRTGIYSENFHKSAEPDPF